MSDHPIIILNSAGCSIMPLKTQEVIKTHLDLANKVGGYEAQRLCEKELEDVYNSLARFLNCSPSEVAIMENATNAWCTAVQTIGLKDGDEIITIESEYISNYLMFLHLTQNTGVKIHVIPNNDKGEICLQALSDKINQRTRLISITHVPTNSGRINPVEEIGQIPRPENCFYLVDACQAVGQMPVDVEKINCDFLSATSRKFIRGPRGVGFLYVNKKRLSELEPTVVDLQSATFTSTTTIKIEPTAKRFENKERNIANVLGFGKSLEVAMEFGLENIFNKNKELADHVRKELSEIEDVKLHVTTEKQCAIVTFHVENIPSNVIVEMLRDRNIYTSLIDPAGALLESEKENLPHLVRVSPHYENTILEIDQFLRVLREIISNH